MSKYIKKLGQDKLYKRPNITYQEKLTPEEISKKLDGYEKVDDIADVPLNTHIRYFIIQEDGTEIFRTGGFLHNKTNAEKYVMVSNGKNIWSVQVANTIFFRKMSQKEEIAAIRQQYDTKLKEKDQIIDKLKKFINANINKSVLEKIPVDTQSNKKPNPTTSKKPEPTTSKKPNPTTSKISHTKKIDGKK